LPVKKELGIVEVSEVVVAHHARIGEQEPLPIISRLNEMPKEANHLG
jgi:hypothetical protein